MTYSTGDRKELRARWSPAQISSLNRQLSKDIGKAEGLPKHEGRLDLRGLSINGNVTYRRLSELDLSCCLFDGFGQFNFCQFTDCMFVSAAITNNLNNGFESCSFQAAKLSELTTGESFVACDFTSSRWARVLAVRTTFSGCSFRKARFSQVKLIDCTFDDCDLSEAEFKQCELESTQFSNCKITQEQIVDSYLEDVRIGV